MTITRRLIPWQWTIETRITTSSAPFDCRVISYCPRCDRRWRMTIRVTPVIGEDFTPATEIIESVTTCTVCHGETEVVDMPDALRDAIRANHDSPAKQ